MFVIAVCAAVLLMGLATFAAMRVADFNLQRVNLAHQQLDAMNALDVASNRYSEQIAEMLLIGSEQRSDLENAKAQVKAGLDKFEQAARAGVLHLSGHPGLAREVGELKVAARLRALYEESERVFERMLALNAAGQRKEAVRVFRDEIEERLDDEFQRLLDSAMANERSEVAVVEKEATATVQRSIVIVIVIGSLTAILCLLSGYALYRSLAQPIKRLSEGAAALGSGDLAHRINAVGEDELATLARSFDGMASQLQAQREMLLHGQSTLEGRIEQRTVELADTNRRLKSLDRVRVQFLADISHELRTPITILRGEAEVTLRSNTVPEESYRATLTRIVEQAAELGILVDDLLFLTRAETDTLRLQRERVNLNDLLVEAARKAEVLGGYKHVTIDFDAPHHRVAVDGDRKHLQRLLMIALDNAVKYSEARGVVRVVLTSDGDHAEIIVRNRGVEIAAEDLPHVFDRYYRSDSAARQADGSGLGLPIAKWIVEKHNGSIALGNAPEGEIELRIRLPRGRFFRSVSGGHGTRTGSEGQS